ncbi:ABC transporter ATP-binding protein [Candidatus Woesearchaeota archaeon]|nr:ABC transporter ATP-binding protein [Candidatus Woesearchaeota archaeon]
MGIKDNAIVFLARKMWEYSAGNRKNVVLYASLAVIANMLNMFEPLIIAKVLNIIQEEGVTDANMYTIIGYLSLFILIWIGFWAFHGPSRVIETKNAFLCRANYKKHLVDGTMDLSAEWHTDHHSGDTIDKIEKGTQGLYEYATHTFEVISTIIKLSFAYVALSYFNIHSSYIVAFMILITISIIVRFDRILIRQYKELFTQENKISEKIFDVISNITTVIILRIEKLVSSAIYSRIMTPLKLFVNNNKLNETKWFAVSCCASLTVFLVLSSYIFFNKGAIMVGTVFALYGYVTKITNIFFHFAYRYGDIVKWRAQVSNVEEISDQFETIEKVPRVQLKKWKEIKIDNLRFSYHARGEDLHLDNISLTIQKNQKIALVGESGSGKTTLLKVMRDLYHPRHVKLYIDDKQMKHGFKAISDDIALIPQDPEIFMSTIKDNITLGVNRSMKDIKVFTNMACFTEVANTLPKKFDSLIVEKGVNLSGGEKQRLALSRGLIASENKSIVLLDEPTSSVDLKNELKIYQNIFRKFKNKTIISSVHRLHLLTLFDQIYYFSNGRIIASGNFNELLKTPDFKKLWSKYSKAQRLKKLES